MKQGLKPVVDNLTTVLILGSLPGDESLAKQQYYASNTNDFWKLVGHSLGRDLSDCTYSDKVRLLQENGVGLWDVFYKASRPGSGDHNIEDEELNDFGRLRTEAPSLKVVCFNGKKAGLYASLFDEIGYHTVVLPSSSGANRRDQKVRQQAWKNALQSAG